MNENKTIINKREIKFKKHSQYTNNYNSIIYSDTIFTSFSIFSNFGTLT